MKHTILGYTAEEWDDIFVVLKALEKEPPSCFADLCMSWERLDKSTVKGCFKIASLYASNKGCDASDYRNMLCAFVSGYPYAEKLEQKE
jgi:hypothetical protein